MALAHNPQPAIRLTTLAALAAVILFLMTGSTAAFADNYVVNYTITSDLICGPPGCTSFPLPDNTLFPPFSADFSLPAADLLNNGTYDVTLSYQNPYPTHSGGTVNTYVVDAIVSGKMVTDLTVDFDESYPVPPPIGGTGGQNFTASGGTFMYDNSFVEAGEVLGGTYTISALPAPEPTSLLLLGSGLIGCFLRRKR